MGKDMDDGLDEVPAATDSAKSVDAGTPTCDCCASADSATSPVQVAPAGAAEEPSQITLTKCDSLEASAQAAWTAYSSAVGGKAFNGDPLPTWEVMVADPNKKHLVAGWRAAANAAVSTFCASIKTE